MLKKIIIGLLIFILLIGAMVVYLLKTETKGASQFINSTTYSAKSEAKEATTNASTTTAFTTTSATTEKNKETDILAAFSDDQIEYARIWLAYGDNQEIEALNVEKIPANSLINPNDDASASYPYEVVKLAGTRNIDGTLTYHSNRDGTIVLFNVPARWEAEYPSDFKMADFTQEIIDAGKIVTVPTGNPEQIVKLIQLESSH